MPIPVDRLVDRPVGGRRRLAYAAPATVGRRRALVWAALMLALSLAGAAVAVCCAGYVVYAIDQRRQLGDTFCGTCYAQQMRALGPPPETIIPVAFFAAGVALVSVVQSIRFFNAGGGIESRVSRAAPPAPNLCAADIPFPSSKTCSGSSHS